MTRRPSAASGRARSRPGTLRTPRCSLHRLSPSPRSRGGGSCGRPGSAPRPKPGGVASGSLRSSRSTASASCHAASPRRTPPMLRPTGLAVAADAGGWDQRRVHQRAGCAPPPLSLPGGGRQNRPAPHVACTAPTRAGSARMPSAQVWARAPQSRRTDGSPRGRPRPRPTSHPTDHADSPAAEHESSGKARRVVDSAKGGQPLSPFADAELPNRSWSISTRSISQARYDSDLAARGSDRAIEPARPIGRRAIPTSTTRSRHRLTLDRADAWRPAHRCPWRTHGRFNA